MSRYISILIILFGAVFTSSAQQTEVETLEITNGSVHMKADVKYTDFLKKYKGDNNLVFHIYYNPSGSALDKKDIKPKDDEIYFFYGRNLQTSLSEMDFKLGASAAKAFAKKKDAELTALIDFLEFEVFPDQHFNEALAREALDGTLE